MKKKKFLLVFAGLTVSCMLTAGTLVGCGEKHEHTYSKWANSETQHWLVCPDDNAKDENSVADHEFGTDGKCVECGYEKPHTHAYTKWRTSDTEHWKVCPDDNTEGPGTRAPHNYVNGECECGRRDSFSGEVSVGEKFNGKTLTLKKDGQTDVNLTVANGKVTLTNMKYGEWTAICEIFGATVKTTVTVDEGISELDLSGFTAGTAKINMTDGSFTWHRQGHETAKMNLAEEASGNQFVALKIATGADFFDWTTKLDEMRFGVSMTVNGAEHIINFNWRNWERTNIGFSSDIKNWQTENQDKDMGEVNYRGYDAVVTHLFKPNFQGWDDKEKGWGFGTYGGAIIEDGVYFIYQYEAATGNVNIYLSDGETYILVYTEEKMFEKNGKLTAFGITEGETDTKWAGGSHNSGIDREFTFTLGYGTTVNAAVSGEVSEWKSTVNITGNKDEVDGANVAASKAGYSYGETAAITVTVPQNKIATVTVDDGTPRVLEETGDVTYTVTNKTHTVNVVFVSDKFSGEVTVDAAYNGKTITLKKDGQSDINLTVSGGKVTFTNVKLGEWTATCNLLGATLKGNVTLTDVMTELDLSSFVAGTADMNLATGSFTWHRQGHETAKVNLAEGASGDQYVALKIATGSDFLDWAKKQDEMRFGVAMTVNGTEHVINFNWRNWERTNIGFTSDVKNWKTENQDKDMGEVNYRGLDELRVHLFRPNFQGWDDRKEGWSFGTYGGAIIEDGVYFVYHYEAATGNVNVYLSDGVTYKLVNTETELFEKNGKLTAFGITEGEEDTHWAGDGWNTGIDREFTFTLGYGATMNAAVGSSVSEWKSTVNITGNKADVDGAEVAADKTVYEYGETATITVTVPANKIATVTVDGGTPVTLEATDTISFTVTKTEYTVNVVFTSDKFTGDVTVGEAYNGNKLTLTKEGETPVELTVTNGKVTFTNIKLGEWNATFNLLGATLKGTVTLIDGMTQLDLSGFATGTADMNLANGEFKWYRQSHKTVKLNLAEGASGDQYVALKIATASDFFEWTTKLDEMRFGVAMTVNGAEHIINFNWRNWERTNIGFSSDIKNWQTENQDKDMGEVNYRGRDELWNHLFSPNFQGWDDKEKGWSFGTYGGAIIEDGVYFIYQYEAATGNVNIYLSDGETYILVYTEEEMFEKNGKLTAFGITEGETDTKWAGGSHNSGIDREFTFTLGYGTTVNAAVGDGVSEWKSTVNITGNKADVEGAEVTADKTAYGFGETATITVTVPENKIATVTVDNGTPVILEESGEVTINTINKLQYTVNVVFASDKFTGDVTVGEAFNGKTLTLKKDGQSDVNLTVADGKVTLTDVKLGEWTAICNLLGMNLKTTVTLTDGMTSLDLSGFLAGTADVNLETGAFVYTSKKDDAPTVGVELAEAKTGDTYVGLKMSTDCTLEDLTHKYEELHLGIWMTVGDSKHWVELHWRNWQARSLGIHTDANHNDGGNGSDTLKDLLWKPTFVGDEGGSSYGDGTHGWELGTFGEAFLGDGIYLIMKYEAATGNVDVLLAKSDGYVKVCTFEKMFAANGEVKGFGVGATDGSWGFHETPGGFKIDCVLNYGATIGEATGEEITEAPQA